jgi:molybdopterin molybdotransferase
MFNVKTLQEAKTILLQNCDNYPLTKTLIKTENAKGYVVSKDVFAVEDVPLFNRSTVDGYACNYEDIKLASESTPAILQISGEVEMGKEYVGELKNNQAIIVPTGGQIPCGANVSVMIEHTELLEDNVLIFKKASKYENIILKSADISIGQRIIKQRHIITARSIGALMSQNIKEIECYNKLSATILSSGDELVKDKDMLNIGEVRDINTYTIKESLKNHNIEIDKTIIIRDNLQQYKKEVLQAFETSDIIFASGASSVGEKDYTINVLEEIGADILVHGLNIKPGKPTIIAKYKNKLFVGLPGHPTSAYIVLSMLLNTILESIYKTAHVEEYFIEGTLDTNVHNNSGRMFIQLVEYKDGLVYPIHYKSSMIHSLTVANGYIIVPDTSEGMYQGETVKIYKLGD